MLRNKRPEEFKQEIDKNAEIIEVEPQEQDGNYTVVTQLKEKLQSNPAILFKNIQKDDVVAALRKQNSLDTFVTHVFRDLSSYIENGYKIVQFHKSMIGYTVTFSSPDSPNKVTIDTSTEELCQVLNVDELDLSSNPCYISFKDFMKDNGNGFRITAFQKRANRGYLVHITSGQMKKDFGSVKPTDLAGVLGLDPNDLPVEENVHVLEAEQSAKVVRENLLP